MRALGTRERRALFLPATSHPDSAAWPPSALKCTRTGLQNGLHRPTVLVLMLSDGLGGDASVIPIVQREKPSHDCEVGC